MGQITVRQIPDEVHRALKVQAEQDGMSAEAKARQLLAEGLFPKERPRPGEMLRALWQDVEGHLDDVEFSRDTAPIRGAEFE